MAVLPCTAMDLLHSLGVSWVFLILALLYLSWYVAVIVLLYKIWQRLDRLPSQAP
jgi:hypothetical protein